MISLQSITDLYIELTRQSNEYKISVDEMFYGHNALRKLVKSILGEDSFKTWIEAINEYERTTYG